MLTVSFKKYICLVCKIPINRVHNNVWFGRPHTCAFHWVLFCCDAFLHRYELTPLNNNVEYMPIALAINSTNPFHIYSPPPSYFPVQTVSLSHTIFWKWYCSRRCFCENYLFSGHHLDDLYKYVYEPEWNISHSYYHSYPATCT